MSRAAAIIICWRWAEAFSGATRFERLRGIRLTSSEARRDRQNAIAFIPASGVAQIEMRGRAHVEMVENVLYFRKTSPPINQADLDALTAFMAQEYSLAWKAQLTNEYVHREVYGTDLTSATSFTSTNVSQAGIGGTLAGIGLPGNVTFTLSFRTPNRGRSGRGRNYWPLLAEADVTGNFLSTTRRNALIGVYNRLISGPPTGWEWGVLSRYTNGAPRVNGLFIPITHVIAVDDAIDSQRRRLAARGT